MKLIRENGSVVAEADAITWNAAQFGWEVGGSIYVDPEHKFSIQDEAPVTWATAPAEYFWIDVGPFFDRFGAKQIEVLSSPDNLVRGLVTSCMARKYIDLKRPDLAQLVGILKTKGIITDAELAAVLVQETTDYERHVKNLPQPTE